MTATGILLGGGAGLLGGLAMGAVLRRGRYRRGDEQTRAQAPAAAVGAAGLALGLVGVTAEDAPAGRGADLAPVAVFAVVGLVAAWTDLDVRRIPNLISGAGTAAVLTAAAVAGPQAAALRALACAGILLAAFALLALATSTGAGDVKFAAAVGGALGYEGWRAVLLGVTAGMALAAAVAVALLALGRSRRSHLPLAPPLAVGALLVLLGS